MATTSAADLRIIRRAYARQIMAASGMLSERVGDAFATVPREDFLGPGPWPVGRLRSGNVLTHIGAGAGAARRRSLSDRAPRRALRRALGVTGRDLRLRECPRRRRLQRSAPSPSQEVWLSGADWCMTFEDALA